MLYQLGYNDSSPTARFSRPILPTEKGFEDSANVGVSYDYTTRRMTFTHASGTVHIWSAGIRYALASPAVSPAHTAADGKYFLTFVNGSFVWSTSAWNILTDRPAAYAYYNVTSGDYFGLRECHGQMEVNSHLINHEKVGTYRRSGGLLTAGTFAVGTGGDTDANVTPGTDSVVLADEDLQTTLPAYTQGSYTRVHFISSSVVFTKGSALPFPVSGGIMQYNPTGTSLATMTSNNYANVYVIYMPVTSDAQSQKYGALWFLGQAQYTTVAAAAAEDPRSLNFGNFLDLAAEFIPFIQIPYRYNTGYGGTGKVRIEQTPAYLTGTKTSLTSLGGISSNSHSTLSGRDAADSHPATAISVTPTGNLASSEVQAALVELQADIDTRAPYIYPNFNDYIEVVGGSAKSFFTISGYAIAADHALDISIDGRDQPLENIQWTRTVGNPGVITLSEAIAVGKIFKCRVYHK